MRQTRRRLKNSPRLHLSGQLHRRTGLHNLAHRLSEPRGELHERLTANLIRVNAVLVHRQVGVELAATLHRARAVEYTRVEASARASSLSSGGDAAMPR